MTKPAHTAEGMRTRVQIILVMLSSVLFVSAPAIPAYAGKSVNAGKLADAIYLAEGGAKTAHAYGILAKYKHTTPRQACLNTIANAQRDWDGKGDFIAFLGARYAPTVGAKNDPTGLNRNWIKNVRYFYEKGT